MAHPRVEFYVDGVHQYTSRTHTPSIPGEFSVGLWFPNGWAGDPDFVTRTLEIDRVAITPMENIITGDANGNGVVDLVDLSVLAANFDTTDSAWSLGDFSGDGFVDLIDLSLLASNFGSNSNVPEPIAALPLLAWLVVNRRR
ncbi:MAG: hypothetical protein RLN76_08840 [Phycisphaeraceae bacterium]